MDTILRLLEGLRRDETVWLNTYLTGRLRAMPPPAAAAATARASAGPVHADIAADSVDDLQAVALAERVGDFNISMDPWEQTGAAPQGWAAHARQTVIPVQGYIHGGGKASPSVSIFSRSPLCSHTCRHCRSKPCDIATEHDDHMCFNCEQRLLFPERIPKWEMQKLPICDLWCHECATQRCCARGPHQHHQCMECERRGVVFLAPAGGEDPWAASEG